jgi:hypothetical protein
MEWLTDLFYFLFLPGLMMVIAILTYRGPAQKYKIVKETNSLGESRYEVWFGYSAFPLVQDTWRLEDKFDTEELANDYVARYHKTKLIIKEGTL